jgi:hypothetical protein
MSQRTDSQGSTTSASEAPRSRHPAKHAAEPEDGSVDDEEEDDDNGSGGQSSRGSNLSFKRKRPALDTDSESSIGINDNIKDGNENLQWWHDHYLRVSSHISSLTFSFEDQIPTFQFISFITP